MDIKSPIDRIVGGIFVIALGVMALISILVEAGTLSPWVWIVFMAISAVVFAGTYIRTRETWTAIVTYVTGAIAVFLLLVEPGELAEGWVAPLVLALIGAPLIVSWFYRRENWGLLLAGYILLAIIPIVLLSESADPMAEERLIPAYVFVAVGVAYAATVSGLPSNLAPILGAIALILVGAYILWRGFTQPPQPPQPRM